jgi:hypothetical protein
MGGKEGDGDSYAGPVWPCGDRAAVAPFRFVECTVTRLYKGLPFAGSRSLAPATGSAGRNYLFAGTTAGENPPFSSTCGASPPLTGNTQISVLALEPFSLSDNAYKT